MTPDDDWPASDNVAGRLRALAAAIDAGDVVVTRWSVDIGVDIIEHGRGNRRPVIEDLGERTLSVDYVRTVIV